jgi:hypothetical protein
MFLLNSRGQKITSVTGSSPFSIGSVVSGFRVYVCGKSSEMITFEGIKCIPVVLSMLKVIQCTKFPELLPRCVSSPAGP